MGGVTPEVFDGQTGIAWPTCGHGGCQVWHA